MNVLDKICADKRVHVAARKTQTPLSALQEKIKMQAPPRGFIRSLRARAQDGKPALIAEIKKASPSGGLIRPDFDPAVLARLYESAGASCLSVLTDTPYFQGCDDDLIAARSSVSLPAIRKDFMVDSYQIYESRALGADCILLIMASLTDDEAREFYGISQSLGMDTLIEIHDEEELDRALALDPAPSSAMIGVNSRNLKTMKVDLATAVDLAPKIPADVIRVGESGIKTHEDLMLLRNAGYEAFLVGESLMRQDDLAAAVEALLNGALL